MAIKQDIVTVREAYAIASDAERKKIVAWLRENADQIIGHLLTGDYDTKTCELMAQAIELAANDIEAKEHWK